MVKIDKKQNVHAACTHEVKQLMGFFFVSRVSRGPVPAHHVKDTTKQTITFMKFANRCSRSVRVSNSIFVAPSDYTMLNNL